VLRREMGSPWWDDLFFSGTQPLDQSKRGEKLLFPHRLVATSVVRAHSLPSLCIEEELSKASADSVRGPFSQILRWPKEKQPKMATGSMMSPDISFLIAFCLAIPRVPHGLKMAAPLPALHPHSRQKKAVAEEKPFTGLSLGTHRGVSAARCRGWLM
jgi:hypothetical protein